MAAALAAAAAGEAPGGSAADEQYGREMWARCEALTSGGLSWLLTAPRSMHGQVLLMRLRGAGCVNDKFVATLRLNLSGFFRQRNQLCAQCQRA